MGLALGKVVRRRSDQSLLQLSRPSRRNLAQKQGRNHLGRRARRSPHIYLSTIAHRSLEVRKRAETARHSEGRHRSDLHGHDSRVAERDDRVSANWGDYLCGIRRKLWINTALPI